MYYDYDEPHWVYQINGRFRFSRTLYIGETNSVPRRMSQHRREKDWWPDNGRISWRQYPDRASALEAEARAIRRKHPVHNIQHNTVRVEVSVEAEVNLSLNGVAAVVAGLTGLYLLVKWGADVLAVRRERELAQRQGIGHQSPAVANPFTQQPLSTAASVFYAALVVALMPPAPIVRAGDLESAARLLAWKKNMDTLTATWGSAPGDLLRTGQPGQTPAQQPVPAPC